MAQLIEPSSPWPDIPLGLTFDDVLLLPGESDLAPDEIDTSTATTENTARLRAHEARLDTGSD